MAKPAFAKKLCVFLCLPVLLTVSLFSSAQITYTANNTVPAYNNFFKYGINMGYFGSSWSDITLSNISAGNPSQNIQGINSKTLRITLPEDFLDFWGYDVRLNEFNHYNTIGIRENTIFLGGTAAYHRENADYGCGQTYMWSNMFTAIWDGGANGTPVNDNNYYALYVYKTVTRYKNNTRFWEIINEPDYDISSNGWKDPGQPGNWWDANPNPCALANLRAPVFHYNRLLRISYEVIKTLDPEAFIAVGGIGYPSFLDAILRNTDNPVDGSVTAEYPLKGGAYFDVLSFHNYPMYALKYWDNSILNFAFKRHSDAATEEFIEAKDKMATVLGNHGYNNAVFPAKHFICTETNIPSKAIGEYIGSELAQANYVMKTLIEAQRNNIKQLYYYMLGDIKSRDEATDPYDLMGMYKKLEGIGPLTNGGDYAQQYNSSGIGYKTTSDLLQNYRYDEARTIALTLPSTIGGAAFRDDAGNYRYALWAKTTTDNSESASAIYSFPSALGLAPQMVVRYWDFSINNINHITPSSNVLLTSTPVFLEENFTLVPIRERDNRQDSLEKSFAFSIFPSPASVNANIRFRLTSPASITVSIFDQQGRFIKQLPIPSQLASGAYNFPFSVVGLSSGAYYCRLQTEKLKIIRKFTVAK